MNPFTRARLMKIAAGTVLAASSLLSVATLTHASSLTSVQVSAILGLLQSFGADQSTITNVQAALTGSSGTVSSDTSVSASSTSKPAKPMNPPPLAKVCAKILINLKRGSSGEDVSRLQTLLGSTVTGKFDVSTEVAVKKWQAEHQIVTSGSAETNGFGAVGPKTKMMLNAEFEKRCLAANKKMDTATSSTQTN